jgi:hypothetical protein
LARAGFAQNIQPESGRRKTLSGLEGWLAPALDDQNSWKGMSGGKPPFLT